MATISVTGNPADARFPASRIAKLLGIDYPDAGQDSARPQNAGAPKIIPTANAGDAAKFLAQATGISEGEVVAMAGIAVMDVRIGDEKVMRYFTGVGPEDFEQLAGELARRVAADPESSPCRYWDDSKIGLAPRHMLFMYLEHLVRGEPPSCVAACYGVDPERTRRCFAYVKDALAGMLPGGAAE